MQETNFDVELIIADDCSPDKTEEIVNNFISTHPKGKLIKYFRHSENIGMHRNGAFAGEQCKGKYVAICEGDDYWTDPLKLQKQVDFLESEDDSVLCFHLMHELHQDGALIPQKQSMFHESIQYRSSLYQINYIATLTTVFKREYLDIGFIQKYSFAMGDYILYLSLLKTSKHKILFVNEYMGVYRYGRPESVSNSLSKVKFYLNSILVLNSISKVFKNLTAHELSSIYNGLAREHSNLFKIYANNRKYHCMIINWLKSLYYFTLHTGYSRKGENYFFTIDGLCYNTKKGIKSIIYG